MDQPFDSSSAVSSTQATLPFGIREWQIWYTYSSYLWPRTIDLRTVAANLIALEIALATLDSEGQACWLENEVPRVSSVEIRSSEDWTQATIHFPKPQSPEITQALFDLARLQFEENKIMTEGPPHAYCRAVLGVCQLIGGHATYKLYPILTVYETGVVLVSLRVFGRGEGIPESLFLTEYVNLFLRRFTTVLGPPGLARIAPDLEERPRSLFGRWQHSRMSIGHAIAVTERQSIIDDTDFSYNACPLPVDAETPESLTSFALTLIQAVAYSAAAPRQCLGYVILGPRAGYRIGSRWTGRPHVHLITFDGQTPSAAENQRRYSSSFASILMRAETETATPDDLGPNLRRFDDSGIYLNETTLLFVETSDTASAVEVHGTRDPNWAHLIHRHEAAAFLLEYNYALHHAVTHRASDSRSTAYEMLAMQRERLEIDATIEHSIRFGEIREFLRKGRESFELSRLREDFIELIGVRRQEALQRDSDRSARISTVLTVAFGLLAVPSLANDVLAPLWAVFGWPRPESSEKAKLLFVSVAVSLVTTSILGLTRAIGRKQ